MQQVPGGTYIPSVHPMLVYREGCIT